MRILGRPGFAVVQESLQYHSGGGVQRHGVRPLAEPKHCGRRARGQLAVDDVAFTVARGESLAVVGESGSGKTTVACMLLGLENPTSGTVSVCGRVRNRRTTSAERRRRAREIQIVRLPGPVLLTRPIAAYWRRHRDQPRLALHDDGQRTACPGLESVGLAERHAAMLPRHLSGGQRQRVAIARAIAVEPQALVLDEAVAALNVSIRRRSSTSLPTPASGVAVVHRISDDAIVMSGGRVVERGPTMQLLRAGNGLHQGLAGRSTPAGLEAAPKPPLKCRRWAARPPWSLR
ncbi:ATP-binding cassette domain-containing protein [Streptomyces atratus]|uniref:ATP-binding cassette domain-containing protein n=1 Tax=Streptomyces atratus TaxID=1893 RepID=UPI0037BDA14B